MKDCLFAIYCKWKAYNSYKQNKGFNYYANFKCLLNYCKHVILEAKKAYDNNMGTYLLNTKNQQKFWNFIKCKTKSSNGNMRITDSSGNAIINSELCNAFNNYFASNYTSSSSPNSSMSDAAATISPCITTDKDYNDYPNHISLDEIRNAINKINIHSAQGNDRIPGILLVVCEDILNNAMSTLFNSILFSGHFPNCWKTAVIVPVPKKGDSNCLENYHPISLLPILSKLFELIINLRIIKFIDDKNLLSTKQFGF